jgi:(1->4)-alpha-D-glucan 1-alpha-D-glucosylmutase
VVKATREAMIHTRWTRPNLAHEQALAGFVDSILSPKKSGQFLAEFGAFHAHIAFFGMINSLSQALLKITCPGVPDFYQGSELWNLRLVDPDNRRAVDFELAKSCLTALGQDPRDLTLQSDDLLAQWTDGWVKMWVTSRALHFRREHPPLFADGAFAPLKLSGSGSDCAVSFLRRHGRDWAIVVVPRWLAQAQAPANRIPPPEFWDDTLLHLRVPCPVSWRNVFTDQRVMTVQSRDGVSIKVADALRHFPVALLSASSSGDDGSA